MKVAILGTVPAHKLLAPFDDPEWNIWICSAANRAGAVPTPAGRTTWFELHGIDDLKGAENKTWAPEYFAWLRAQSFPVYMQEPNDLVPQSVVFPRNILIEKFGRLPFTSSVAWMIAFAIHQGATDIGIFGVDMAATEEHYGAQKFGCLRMMEVASELGINVQVPLESCLGQMPPLYGYAETTRMGRKLLVQEHIINESIAAIDNTIARLTAERHFHAGALDQVRYLRRTFVNGLEDSEVDFPEIEHAAAKKEAAQSDPLRVYEARPSGLLAPAIGDHPGYERGPDGRYRARRPAANGADAHPET